MALVTRFLPSVLSNSRILSNLSQKCLNFHSLTSTVQKTEAQVANPGGLFNLSVRTVIRDHFPRPSEKKRVKRHGFLHRMSTPAGRRILMNRILKGRHVLSH
ncbi:39S ribosomal protein L34, mitochondrial [Anthonomus grandis grandis]|uniref:39S ribosomal protein L34, mitochondrial n=1 Tax=Anthonomus grandis grandis TaxID=2921223 RepID=UPI002166123B|nr:39S ribosomal protein L34, mitochondrial [Anthonomus grandis grandis]